MSTNNIKHMADIVNTQTKRSVNNELLYILKEKKK